MAEHGPLFLRWSLGIVFLWFGALKFFPGLSSAEDLATRTLSIITFGKLTPTTLLFILAVWESAIGLGLLSGRFLRVTLLLLFLQMAGTLTPFLFFPKELFLAFPIALTLEGQYIVKNIVLISAALVLGATVRGGMVVPDPKIAEIGRKKIEQEKHSVSAKLAGN